MHRAHPPLKFIPQQFNPVVLRVAQALLPLLLRLRLRPWLPAGIAEIETINGETLVQLYQQFQVRKIRFLIAFRHPEVDDPLCMFHLVSHAVPAIARQQGISLKSPIHSHFIYDRGMTIWAGRWLGWFFSRLGGFPIHRGKRLDRVGLRTARDVFANGAMPIAVAPEGATNGHSEVVSPLEPGVAQMSFWCCEDLAKANREEAVVIVPIGIQYHYIQAPWPSLNTLLGQLENDSGLSVQTIDLTAANREALFYDRLFRLGEHVLSKMEQFYDRFNHQEASVAPPSKHESSDSPNDGLASRLQTLLDRALRTAEEFFKLPPQGTVIERCRRLEEACWNDVYREDLPNLETLPALDRGLADWLAEEAELRIRHMRLVESFVAVTGYYVKEKPTVERFAETTLLLFDLIARLRGDKYPKRPRLGWRRATLTVGTPLSVSDRWPTYQTDRKKARQAVNDLTHDLQTALEKLIA